LGAGAPTIAADLVGVGICSAKSVRVLIPAKPTFV
jgi:hypothetical protein